MEKKTVHLFMNWATVVVLTQLVHYSHLLMKLTLSLYMHDKKKIQPCTNANGKPTIF